MRRAAPGLILFLAAMPAFAAAAGVDVVAAGYAGTWKVEIDHLDTPYSKAAHENNTLRNECWKSGGFLACNQYVDGVSKALLVFTYDAVADRYTSYPVPTDGSAAEKGTLLIRGNTWTYPWQVKDATEKDSGMTYFRVVNVFTKSDTIEFRQEFSKDNEHWTVMARGLERRMARAKVQ